MPDFWVIIAHSSGLTVILRFLSIKIEQLTSPFQFLAVTVSRCYSVTVGDILLQFSRYQDKVFCIILTYILICAKICGNGFLNFAPQNLESFRSQKISSQKTKVDLGGLYNVNGRKIKNTFPHIFNNLSVILVAKFKVDVSKTLRGDSFPLKLYFFNKNWQHCILATF